MLQVNVKNDSYVFLYCDGVDNNVVELSKDDLRDKQIVILLEPNFCSIPTYGRRIIEQINELTEMEEVNNNVIILPSNDKFDFNKELNVEELLYGKYGDIKHPEMISARTLDYFATDENDKMVPIHTIYPLSYCKNIDRKIEIFAADIKNSDLSSFEKILATYVMCTHFINTDSEYEQDGVFINRSDLKNVYGSSMHILSDGADGYKIKCGGYVDLFSRLIRKMNLSSKPMVLSNVDGDFGHVVSLVDINDKKYGIDGSFVCDLRSDSDYREYREEKDRKDIGYSSNYWGFNSLGYFCMNCDDFIFLLGLNKFNSPTIYSTDSINSCNDCRQFVSKKRIPIESIQKALGTVYRYVYSIDDNLDSYLNGGVLDEMGEGINREIEFVRRMRRLADNNASSNSNSTNDLENMVNEHFSNKDSVSNRKNEHKK